MKDQNPIKRIRNNEGLTQEEFSKKINLKRSTLALIETNKIKPSVEVYEKINEVFGINLIGKNNRIVMNKNNFSPKSAKKDNESVLIPIESDFYTLSLTYDDQMKMLYFLTSILRHNNYEFTINERKELLQYEKMNELMWDVRDNNKIEKQTYDSIERTIKVSMFRSVSNYQTKVEALLKVNTEYSFSWISIKPTKKLDNTLI